MAAEHPEVDVAESDEQVASFSAFYVDEHAEMVRWAALVMGADSVANDVVHDAFIEVWRRWGSLERPGGYLRRCVLNGCRDWQRSQRRARDRRHLVAVDVATVEESPLFDLLDRLPFKQRAALVLRYYGGLPEAEIAAALGARPGSVGPWITRGLRALREELS